MTTETTFASTEFDNELTAVTTIPWLQVINHPKLSAEKAQRLGEPWGIFLSAENAEAVNFTANDDWEFTEVEFKPGTKNAGLISRSIRAVFVHRSGLEVQARGESGRWEFLDLAYRGGKITPSGEHARDNREDYRKVTRSLLYLLGQDNKPLHTSPLQFTTRGAFGAALGVDLGNHYAQFENVFFKSQGRPVKAINASGRSRIVYAASLGVDFAGFEAKGLNPAIYMAARQCAVTKPENLVSKDVQDCMGRDQLLQGVMLSTLFIPSSSEFGQQLANDFALYESFPLPNRGQSEPEPVAPPVSPVEVQDVDRFLGLDEEAAQARADLGF